VLNGLANLFLSKLSFGRYPLAASIKAFLGAHLFAPVESDPEAVINLVYCFFASF